MNSQENNQINNENSIENNAVVFDFLSYTDWIKPPSDEDFSSQNSSFTENRPIILNAAYVQTFVYL